MRCIKTVSTVAILVFTVTPPVLAEAPEAPGGEPVAQAMECLAEAVYFEARGTSETAQEAVAHVVTNRAEAGDFPGTICGVVNEGCQFSYNCDGKPETMADAESRREAVEIAQEVLAEEVPDPTEGALYFHSEGVAPDWSDDFDRTTKIGDHIFYR